MGLSNKSKIPQKSSKRIIISENILRFFQNDHLLRCVEINDENCYENLQLKILSFSTRWRLLRINFISPNQKKLNSHNNWQQLQQKFDFKSLRKGKIWEYIQKITLYKKMKFSIKDFCSKCDQIRSFLRTWSYLLKKYLIENFIFYAVLL